MLLQQQYLEKGFTKYFELISCLLVTEQNIEILLKNHESRPTGSALLSKMNVATRNNYNHEPYRGRGCGHGSGRNHSLGCGRGYRGGNSKNISSTRSGKMVKKNLRKKTIGKLANIWRRHAIVVVENVIGPVLVVHQSILLTFIKNL
ncbi:UNVERIFIED_CONTAM: hypothetical protein Sangu_2846000 [Sesamum angustifolium]|uniref:Uncharacterized protein n=1 Tax=Sesamum angustifolium TaxID=2727405 RepID=A0AAW2IQJ4_9LAMI